MALEGLLNNLYDTVNLGDSHRADFREFRDGLISLRNTSSNNNRFLNLLSLADHADEGILGWIDDCAAVDKD